MVYEPDPPVQFHRYLGPFVELPVELKTQIKDNCGAPAACPNPTSGTCPTCGIQVSRRLHHFQRAEPPLYPVVARVLYDALHLTDGHRGPERLSEDKVVHRLIANTPREEEPPRDFYLPENECWRDLTGIDVAAEKAWLERAFQYEIDHLRKLYGELHVKWGFLQWKD